MKRVFFSLALAAGLQTAAFSRQVLGPQPAKFIVTPQPAPLDENAQILGIEKWRFRISAPKATTISYRLELHQPKRKAVVLAGMAISGGGGDLLVSILPLNDALMAAPRLRVLIGRDGTSGQNTVANPLRSLNAFSRSTESPARRESNGSWTLMEFGRVFPDSGNTRLRLWISPKNNALRER
ncbi:MAG TPA: hypothetical protein VF681_13870 [Abditibacteriaceae bacterium]|jgi:hypothetical protein